MLFESPERERALDTSKGWVRVKVKMLSFQKKKRLLGKGCRDLHLKESFSARESGEVYICTVDGEYVCTYGGVYYKYHSFSK